MDTYTYEAGLALTQMARFHYNVGAVVCLNVGGGANSELVDRVQTTTSRVVDFMIKEAGSGLIDRARIGKWLGDWYEYHLVGDVEAARRFFWEQAIYYVSWSSKADEMLSVASLRLVMVGDHMCLDEWGMETE